jgi:hypothetical protein
MDHFIPMRRHQLILTYFDPSSPFISVRTLQYTTQKIVLASIYPSESFFFLGLFHRQSQASIMPAAFASSKSSNEADSDPIVSTPTSGDNVSASASSKNKEGGIMSQISRPTEDEHGSHTTKTTKKRDSDGKKDTKTV